MCGKQANKKIYKVGLFRKAIPLGGRGSAPDFPLPQTTQRAVCYDIESAIGRNRVRWSLTVEGVLRFLREREPDHFIIARGGKALWTGREFLEEHGERVEDDA